MSIKDDAGAVRLRTRLREVREYLGLSQQFVASQTGILRSALADIERGNRKVEALELRRLARLYRHPVEHFLSEAEGEPTFSTAFDEPESTLVALGRAAGELTEQDQREVLRFAEFLKNYGDAESRVQGRSR